MLAQAGFCFEVLAADIDEAQRAGEAAETYVARLALEKAVAVAALRPGAVVVGADTTVVVDRDVLGKPRDHAEAASMLRRLSGRQHEVLTGLAVVSAAGRLTHVERTCVTFGEVGETELATYVASGEAMDKAGAYGIQGYAARWIPRIEGDYFNVVGLPIAALMRMLREFEGGPR